MVKIHTIIDNQRTSEWMTMKRVQHMALVAKSGRFAMVVASRLECTTRSAITPSDFGRQVGSDIIKLMASIAISEEEDDPLFACSLTFTEDEQKMPDTFTYDASLAYAMMMFRPLQNIAIPIDTTPFSPTLHQDHIKLHGTSNDQSWQMVATSRLCEKIRHSSVTDPAQEIFEASLGRHGTMQYMRNGYYRVVPGGRVPVATFTFGGIMLYEQTGVGKTRVAVRAIQRLRSPVDQTRLAPNRRFLPRTSIVVVPSHTVDSWAEKIHEVWSDCKIRVVRMLRDLTEVKDPDTNKRRKSQLEDQLTTLGALDIVLVSRDLWLKGAKLRPKPETISVESPLSFFRDVQFRCAVIDEAHAYIVNKRNVISPAAIVIRTHAFAAETLLLTATPSITVVDDSMQYMYLVGVSHSRDGRIYDWPLSQHEIRERQFWDATPYNADMCLPSLLQLHTARTKYRWMVDHVLVARAVHAFTQHQIVHTNASLQQDLTIRYVHLSYTSHPFVGEYYHTTGRIIDEAYTTDRVEQHSIYHGYITEKHWRHPDYLRLLALLDVSCHPDTTTVPTIGFEWERHGDDGPHVTDTISDDIQALVRNANARTDLRPDRFLVSSIAHLRLVCALCQQGAHLLICLRQPSRLAILLKRFTEIQVIELKGDAYKLASTMRRFRDRPDAFVLMLHPNHIDGTDIPEATHILVDEIDLKSPEFKQRMGRATRFGRSEPLVVVSLDVSLPPRTV